MTGPLVLSCLLSLFLGSPVHGESSPPPPPEAQVFVSRLVEKLSAPSVEGSSQSTGATAATTTSPAIRRLARAIDQRNLERSRQILSELRACPAPGSHEAFLRARERLSTRCKRLQRLVAVAREAEDLAQEAGETAEVALRARETEQLLQLSSCLAREELRLGRLWEETIPDAAKRRAIEEQVSRARTERLASEKEDARNRVLEQEETLQRKRRETDELSARAREELSRARTKDEQRLAELRLAYAQIDGRAEEARGQALGAESRAREAEEALEACRTDLSARLPVLARLAPTVRRRSKSIEGFEDEARQLGKDAQVLAREIELAEEAIPGLRLEAQRRMVAYDEMEAGLERHGSEKVYRQQVYFTRLVHRRAAGLLDETRSLIEWKRRLRRMLLDHQALLATAADDLHTKELPRIFGQTHEAWKDFAVAVALTLLAAWLLYPVIRTIFHRIAGATKWTWDDIVLEEAAGPLRAGILLLGAWASLMPLKLSPTMTRIVLVSKGVLSSLLAGFVAWRVVTIVVRILTPRVKDTETTLDDQLLNFLSRTMRAVILFVSGLYVLQAFGWKIANVLAGLGIGGLAFALAAKDTLANLFGSIVLFLDRPFTVGNWVILCGAEGIVEDIGIRSTRIRTFKDTVVTIPNANVANAVAENIHSFRKRRLYFTLELRLDTPPALIETTILRIRQILTDHPMVLDGYYVYLTGIRESGVEIMVYSFVGTRDWGEWMHHSQEVYLTVLKALDELGVGLAYPTRTVEVEGAQMPLYLDPVS